ncbi:MAG: FYDLN acid domain-containing protein, partial [Alphaproteobacteria bacterium]|nr:FYDLN acid domain-containing protein [Alphaproteobacteria bacterium]
YYDFRKNPPICPSCGTIFEKNELIEELESKEDDIPENEDEIIVDVMETMEEDDYNEMDVEEDMQQVDPNLVNDDDIDNVFVEDSIDMDVLENDIQNSISRED